MSYINKTVLETVDCRKTSFRICYYATILQYKLSFSKEQIILAAFKTHEMRYLSVHTVHATEESSYGKPLCPLPENERKRAQLMCSTLGTQILRGKITICSSKRRWREFCWFPSNSGSVNALEPSMRNKAS